MCTYLMIIVFPLHSDDKIIHSTRSCCRSPPTGRNGSRDVSDCNYDQTRDVWHKMKHWHLKRHSRQSDARETHFQEVTIARNAERFAATRCVTVTEIRGARRRLMPENGRDSLESQVVGIHTHKEKAHSLEFTPRSHLGACILGVYTYVPSICARVSPPPDFGWAASTFLPRSRRGRRGSKWGLRCDWSNLNLHYDLAVCQRKMEIRNKNLFLFAELLWTAAR